MQILNMKKPNKKPSKKKPSENIIRTFDDYEFTGINKPTFQLMRELLDNPQDHETAEALIQQGADINAMFLQRETGTSCWKANCLLGSILDLYYDVMMLSPPMDWDTDGDAILDLVRFFLTHGFVSSNNRKGYHAGRCAIFSLMAPTIVYYPKQAREALFLLLDTKPFDDHGSSQISGFCDEILSLQAPVLCDYASLLEPLIISLESGGSHSSVDFYFTAVGKQIQRVLVEVPDKGPILRHVETTASSDGVFPASVLENAFPEMLCLSLPDCYLSFRSTSEMCTLKAIPLDKYADVSDSFPGVIGRTITDFTFTKAEDSESEILDALVHLDNGTVLRFVSRFAEDTFDDKPFWGSIEVLPQHTPALPGQEG